MFLAYAVLTPVAIHYQHNFDNYEYIVFVDYAHKKVYENVAFYDETWSSLEEKERKEILNEFLRTLHESNLEYVVPAEVTESFREIQGIDQDARENEPKVKSSIRERIAKTTSNQEKDNIKNDR